MLAAAVLVGAGLVPLPPELARLGTASVAWAHGPPVAAQDTQAGESSVGEANARRLEMPEPPAALLALLAAEDSPEAQVARRVNHGRWEQLSASQLTAPLAATVLHQAGIRPDRWAEPAASDASLGVALARARAWADHGQFQKALEALSGRGEPGSSAVLLVQARALLDLGRVEEAVPALESILKGDLSAGAGADERCDRAEALLLADTLGAAGGDAVRRASALLDEARELAPLAPRPRRIQAALLFERDNRSGGGEALESALALHPFDAASLRLLGKVAIQGFDFGRASAVLDHLNGLPDRLPAGLVIEAAAGEPATETPHPLGVALEARAALRSDDPDRALAALHAAGESRVDLLPWIAAAEAAIDPTSEAARAALAACEAATPGGSAGHATVGAVLAEARQYPEAIAHLEEAIRRRPFDPAPRLELGRTLAQAGDLPAAVDALREAVRLDSFQNDALNSLSLFERMLDWPTLETENFIVRHAPGIDAVLAADMAREVEAMRSSVTSFFDHEPARRTQIDLLPDAPSFAVRITGRSEIWTIAACTGDVVAMTPPRLGPDQAGNYHWRNVLQHEYAHTVTLDQTGNRIAHWLTEAAAVNAESVGRSYDQARLLANALAADELFAYEDLNWGFVRPKKPTDRSLAYAQSAWMLEHIVEVDGRGAMIAMLDAAAEGATDAGALAAATGLTPEAFFDRFRPWAQAAVKRWGLGDGPPSVAARATLASVARAADPAAAAAARAELARLSPESARHPDVLEAAARLEAAWGSPEVAKAAIERYALARPVDPWPHTALADAALAAGDATAAATHLAVLERSDGMTARSARLLMELHSRRDQPAEGLAAARAALLRQPYDAGLRESAAALAIRSGDWAEALFQVQQLARLEPDEPRHRQRLEAVERRLAAEG